MTLTASPWATVEDLPETCDARAVKPGTIEDALQFASDVLYHLTGRRWPGVRTDTFRPCCGCSRMRCSCTPPASVELPLTPAIAITSVKVDGLVVPTNEYVLHEKRWLVAVRKADGTRRTWPTTQDLTRPSTEQDTFEIAYTWGGLPPSSGVKAAAILGWEFALAWTPNSQGCRLPRRVTSVTRQGVSVAVIDPLTLFNDGLTGVPEVDLWTKSLSRGDARQTATVLVPGQFPGVTRR